MDDALNDANLSREQFVQRGKEFVKNIYYYPTKEIKKRVVRRFASVKRANLWQDIEKMLSYTTMMANYPDFETGDADAVMKYLKDPIMMRGGFYDYKGIAVISDMVGDVDTLEQNALNLVKELLDNLEEHKVYSLLINLGYEDGHDIKYLSVLS